MHEAGIEETIGYLAERWKDAGILLPGFSLLAQGSPVSVTDLAEVSGASPEALGQAIESGRCERDSDGRLIDLYGMSLKPTHLRIEAGKKIVYSCCALWSQVIPKLLGQEVLVESVDPICREIVRLRISPAGVQSVEPANAVATLAVASCSEINEDVCAAFCCNVRHFINRESAEKFVNEFGPSVRIVGIHELQEAGQGLFDAIWSAIREPISRTAEDAAGSGSK
ncbi:hypothetical protein L0222_05720 [bacterium]|nr:hypothetical protein [bacterium]